MTDHHRFPPAVIADSNTNFGMTKIYAKLHTLRMNRVYRGRLDTIAEEINTYDQVIRRSIYYVGELLCEAKELSRGNFQQWITDRFPNYSYQTCNNFMNVYKACLGNPRIADTVKPSVLYQIAAPGFPQDLREHIFEQGSFTLENLNVPGLKELVAKYKAGELDLENEGVKRYFNSNRRVMQVAYTQDSVARCLRDLGRHHENISTAGGNIPPGYENTGADLAAAELTRKALDSIQRCIGELTEVWEGIRDHVYGEVPDYVDLTPPEQE